MLKQCRRDYAPLRHEKPAQASRVGGFPGCPNGDEARIRADRPEWQGEMTAYDAIVVGGGVVGAATAYHLARHGVRTLLLDRRDAGRATDAGAGILSTATATEHPDPIERFEARAAQYYPTLVEALRSDGAGDPGYRMCGSLTVAIDDDEVAHLDQIAAGTRRWRAALDHGFAVLAPEAATALFPPLAPVRGAIHCERGARVDGRLLTAALLNGAQRRGLEIRAARVDELVVERSCVGGIIVAGERIGCGHLVVAAGAWSNELVHRLGIELLLTPQRGQIVHLGLTGVDTSTWPIVLAFRGHYLVPWDDGRVVAGATRETGSGFASRTTAAGVLEVLSEALRVAPGLADAEIREIRVGLRPATRDGLPILGPAPGIDNLLLATGHGATGLQLGPYSGKVIAQMVADGAAETDLTPFSPARLSRFR
jgi:D-amino-acid dehydrogenase